MTLDEPLALSKPRFLLLEKMREIIQTSQEWRGLNNFMQLVKHLVYAIVRVFLEETKGVMTKLG